MTSSNTVNYDDLNNFTSSTGAVVQDVVAQQRQCQIKLRFF